MGKRIIPRRRGRGRRYKAADNRFKGDARHPRSKSSSGKVVELMHDPGRTAPVAKVEDQDGTYTMIAHDGMHVGQEISTGHGAEIDVVAVTVSHPTSFVMVSDGADIEFPLMVPDAVKSTISVKTPVFDNDNIVAPTSLLKTIPSLASFTLISCPVRSVIV